MKSIFACLGGAFVLLFILGATGLIDFHVCIGAPGTCSVSITRGTK